MTTHLTNPPTEPGSPLQPQIPFPRSRFKARKSGNFEMNAWLFMRGSGVLLLALVFGHLFINLWQGEGINQIDFAFVGGKWSSPFWQVWDLTMLWLAMLHGANGLRTIINDYATKDWTRFSLKTLLYGATIVTLILGTLVIFTFDPCPTGSPADLLPEFCTAN